MKIGINGTGLVRTSSVPRIQEDATAAQDDGFSSYWLAEHPVGGLDALTTLAAVGPVAPELELGTAIVPTWPRHPMALAGQALTAHQQMKHRLVLGIGLSHRVMLEQLGLEMTKPIRHLREFLEILMPLLEEGAVDFRGEMLRCSAELFQKPDTPPQVVVAALGPQALRVAGRLAGGTILAWVGPKTIREHIVPTITAAASEAGRDESPRIVATLPVTVTDDPDAAREFGAQIFSMYGELPSYRAMLDREGVKGPSDLQIAGSEDAVLEALEGLRAAGVTDFAASEFGRGEDLARTRELLRQVAKESEA
ncbi:MAG: TIGR03564 family F420-dependent LLM class oxidoreductase [Acidobacteriota bacterium]